MPTVRTLRSFPFCQVSSGSAPAAVLAPDASMPFGAAMDYEKAFGWQWRVREWSFEWTANLDTEQYDWVPNDPDPPLWAVVSQLTFAGSGTLVSANYAAADEKDLNCATRWTFPDFNPFGLPNPNSGRSWRVSETIVGALDWSDAYGASISGGDMDVTIQVDMFAAVGEQEVRWKWTEAGMMVPALRITALFQSPTFPNPEGYAAEWTTLMDGESVPSGVGVPYGQSGTADFSLTLTPASFFEFDPGDGDGPLFDSVTGERTARGLPD